MPFSFNPVATSVSITGGSVTPPTSIQVGCFQKGTTAASTVFDVHTPTGGKILYITAMSVSTATAGQVNVGDNIASGAMADVTEYPNEIVFDFAARAQVTYTFPSPIKIATKLRAKHTGIAAVTISWIGFEQ